MRAITQTTHLVFFNRRHGSLVIQRGTKNIRLKTVPLVANRQENEMPAHRDECQSRKCRCATTTPPHNQHFLAASFSEAFPPSTVSNRASSPAAPADACRASPRGQSVKNAGLPLFDFRGQARLLDAKQPFRTLPICYRQLNSVLRASSTISGDEPWLMCPAAPSTN